MKSYRYRIIRGSINDYKGRCRQGWWWHCRGTPTEWEFGYDPEGPFLTKTYARRHLSNTIRSVVKFDRDGRWSMPPNAGWCSAKLDGKSIMRPISNTLLFGNKRRRYNKLEGN